MKTERRIKLELDPELDMPSKMELWCRSCCAMHTFLRGKDCAFYWGPECGHKITTLTLLCSGILIDDKWRGLD